MKKIGLISDLHLEASNMELDNPGWDYLVIAGDLSSDLDKINYFFSYIAPRDIPIIYVLGNHEYERRRIEDTIPQIKEIIKPFENIILLNNESVVIDDIKFIGTTLWSNFELDGIEQKKENMDWAKINIVDFSAIFDKNEDGKDLPITPEKMVEMNKKAYNFLEYELKNNPFEGSKIVVSHFAPYKNSVHKKYEKNTNSYWVNNFEELLGFSDFWFHGHTHNSFDYQYEGTRVVCNPRGVSKMFNISQNALFNKGLILTLEEKNANKLSKIKI